jgi:hypothetical protein
MVKKYIVYDSEEDVLYVKFMVKKYIVYDKGRHAIYQINHARILLKADQKQLGGTCVV